MATAAMDLREACVATARAVIAAHGIEKLSLRDVARQLGVSHQAPYKHFPSRDHLLAEVMRRCFAHFASHLRRFLDDKDPVSGMAGLGTAYLDYAITNPLEYRLMFGTPWPEAADHPDLLRDARLSFDVLRHAIARMRDHMGAPTTADDLDAIYVWSAMHGLATILQSNVMQKLPIGRGVLEQAVPHTLERVGQSIGLGGETAVMPVATSPKRRAARS